MPFPSVPRVQYETNPLENVICQLRFPPILAIDKETPAAFQERIRKDFPVLREKPKPDLSRSIPGLPAEIAQLVAVEGPFRLGNVVYDFGTRDDLWTVSLARDFVALTARYYETWEDFRDHMERPLKALLEVYEPAFFTRVGLRYKDVICRSRLGLSDVFWSALLKPHIAGELASDDVALSVEQTMSQATIRLEEYGGRVRIRHGLAKETQTDETCYVIDSDFFTDASTEVDDARTILDYFNRQAGRLFQWCITPALHNAMGPRKLT